MTATSTCSRCGFALWVPVADLGVSRWGLYDDARFPGRSLLVLNDHYEDLMALPADLLRAYLVDLEIAVAAIKAVTGAPRINYAVLGNAEPHVHWHLFPRNPDREPAPAKSPWDDPRPRTPLPEQARDELVDALRQAGMKLPIEERTGKVSP